tara:strand:- start:1467 stop:1763 length:297 start_codon:yes stop_codon:yes gene_type:complete
MKILIWVHKSEAISGKITDYYITEPVSNLKDPDKYDTSYVQVQLTQDEFVQLEDARHGDIRQKIADISDKMRDESFLVSQYNRNREVKDQITDESQIK